MGRTMTEAEVAEEAGFIHHCSSAGCPASAPARPPSRRTGQQGQPASCSRSSTSTATKVYLRNMLTLHTGPLLPQLEGDRVLEFETVEDLVRAGWIGD